MLKLRSMSRADILKEAAAKRLSAKRIQIKCIVR